jgi:hypothetical protein
VGQLDGRGERIAVAEGLQVSVQMEGRSTQTMRCKEVAPEFSHGALQRPPLAGGVGWWRAWSCAGGHGVLVLLAVVGDDGAHCRLREVQRLPDGCPRELRVRYPERQDSLPVGKALLAGGTGRQYANWRGAWQGTWQGLKETPEAPNRAAPGRCPRGLQPAGCEEKHVFFPTTR